MAVSIAVLGIAAAPPAPAAAATSAGQMIANRALAQPANWNDIHGYIGNWCADFAAWVWETSGANIVIADHELTAWAYSFDTYGTTHGTTSSTPAIGDAVVFDNCGYVSGCDQSSDPDSLSTIEHVGIVVAVKNNGATIETVEGNLVTDNTTSVVGQAQYYGAPHSGPLAHSSTNTLYPGTWQVREYVAPAPGPTPTPKPTAAPVSVTCASHCFALISQGLTATYPFGGFTLENLSSATATLVMSSGTTAGAGGTINNELRVYTPRHSGSATAEWLEAGIELGVDPTSGKNNTTPIIFWERHWWTGTTVADLYYEGPAASTGSSYTFTIKWNPSYPAGVGSWEVWYRVNGGALTQLITGLQSQEPPSTSGSGQAVMAGAETWKTTDHAHGTVSSVSDTQASTSYPYFTGARFQSSNFTTYSTSSTSLSFGS